MKHFRQFIVAKTPDEAVDLRRSVGVKSLYIAGGTTVVPYAATGVEVLIDITKLGLDSIRFEDDTISIGATTRLSGLDSPDIKATFPMLHEAVRRCATPLIRNMATLGGALGGIHLPSDVGVALLALGAEISLTGETDRVVSMEDLLTDGWLKRHELIKGISIKMPRKDAAGSFQKSGRSEIDIALVNVATTLAITGAGTIDSLRIAVGQTSSMPTLLAGVTDEAVGKKISLALVEQISHLASDSVKTRSDSRASSEYRSHLVRVLVARSIAAAAEEAGFSLED